MKFHTIEIENFMSVSSCTTSLLDKGLVLIQGVNNDEDSFESNGAGKSTIFSEAVCWCLFGETVRGQKGDSVVNRQKGQGTRVSIEILDKNDQYIVTRHRKHKEYKNHVLLFKNSKNITAKSDTDTDILISTILELDFLSFTNSILFGQGIGKMFASSTDAEQKRIMEKMLQIDVFKACQDRAKELHSSSTDKKQTLESDINHMKKQKSQVDLHIEELQVMEAELQGKVTKKIQELSKEIKDKEKAITDIGDPQDLLDKIEELKKSMEPYEKQYSKVCEIEEQMLELVSEQKSIKRDISSTEYKIEQLMNQLESVMLGKNLDKVCASCGQKVSSKESVDSVKEHLLKEIADLQDSVENMNEDLDQISELIKSVNSKTQSKKTLEETIKSIKDSIKDISFDHRSAVSDIDRIKKEIKKCKLNIVEQEKLLDSTFADSIEENVQKSRKLAEDIQLSQEMLEAIHGELDIYNFWSNAFGNQGIKSVLLDSVTPFLNQRSNEYLSKLSSSSIEVKFTTQTTLKSGEKKDKFSVEVINRNGDNDYKGSSNGEKRRIDLAVNLALQDLVSSRSSKNIDFTIYDEAFEGLDSIGCENLIQILKEKQRQCGTIMVITHNDSLKNLFTKSITVAKTDGKTKIIEE